MLPHLSKSDHSSSRTSKLRHSYIATAYDTYLKTQKIRTCTTLVILSCLGQCPTGTAHGLQHAICPRASAERRQGALLNAAARGAPLARPGRQQDASSGRPSRHARGPRGPER
eukprot:363278-Chlamydomonas_euryale.AAC.11